MHSTTTSTALGWKLLERFGVQGVQFILQIILARLLSPSHYGALSVMIIFTNLANVFVQAGFSTALIQKKEVDERDYSSVFWVSLGVAIVLYVALFFLSPLIARFYNMPEIVAPFRLLGLMLIPGAFNSIQLAKVSREMNFKKVFIGNVGGIVIAGTAGIVVAVLGGGLWALVVQSLLNIVVACFLMFCVVRWFPRFIFDFKRVIALLKFGWKLLVSSLIDVLYQDLRSLVIGKKYDSGTLGFYNRGKQFPQFIINAVNGTVQSVMLPAMSIEQDDKQKVKLIMRTSMIVSSYIIFPIMMGLAIVAKPLIILLLTEKWLPAVPYMQIYCFTLAFYPVHSCNLQAINAMGRSDVFLRLEIIKKVIGVISLIIAVFCFHSPIAIAMTGVFTTFISCFINAFPNKKLIGYSYFDQIKDLLPSLLLSVGMGAVAYMVLFLNLANWLTLVIQVLIGISIYALLSILFRPEGFSFIIKQLQALRSKDKNIISISGENIEK